MIIIFSESHIANEILYLKAGYKENDYKLNRNVVLFWKSRRLLLQIVQVRNIEHSYLNTMMNKKYIISSKTNGKSKTSRH